MKNSLLLGLLFFFCTVLSQVAVAQEKSAIPESTYEYGYPEPFAVGIHVGSAGVGAHLYKSLGTQFGARLGFTYMPFHTNILGTYNNREVRSDVKANSSNVSLLLGWTPFVKYGGFFRSFTVSAGGAYFTNINGKLTSRLKEPYQYGDILVDPELVGTITTDVKWKKTITPYTGIGWTNIVIDNRFSMNVDLGMYYLSKPSVSMAATGLLEENVNNVATIERNIKDYRYLPRVEIGFSYRFK